MSDIERITQERGAQVKPARDSHFRLLCGAAISTSRKSDGTLDRDRIVAHVGSLMERGVDVLSRPGVAEKAIALADPTPPPGPNRHELLALIGA